MYPVAQVAWPQQIGTCQRTTLCGAASARAHSAAACKGQSVKCDFTVAPPQALAEPPERDVGSRRQ